MQQETIEISIFLRTCTSHSEDFYFLITQSHNADIPIKLQVSRSKQLHQQEQYGYEQRDWAVVDDSQFCHLQHVQPDSQNMRAAGILIAKNQSIREEREAK